MNVKRKNHHEHKSHNSILILILMPLPTFSAADHSYKSKYAGEEKRVIKSLSETDIEELKNGKGWGLAKAAELNTVPGRHTCWK